MIRKTDLTTKESSVLYKYSKCHRAAMPLADAASKRSIQHLEPKSGSERMWGYLRFEMKMQHMDCYYLMNCPLTCLESDTPVKPMDLLTVNSVQLSGSLDQTRPLLILATSPAVLPVTDLTCNRRNQADPSWTHSRILRQKLPETVLDCFVLNHSENFVVLEG